MELGQAISIAAKAFEGKFDKSGEPYILHCLQVMHNVDKWRDTELKTIAVLHDLIEDTEWHFRETDGVWEDARCFLIGGNSEVEISHRAMFALALLTHEDGVPYEDYIAGICNSQDAIRVKMGDIEHNSSILRLKGVQPKDLQRIEKYHKSYMKLEEALVF